MDSLISQNRLPRAILFDNDGVLIASEPLHFEAWKILLKEVGLPFQESELHGCIGKTAPETLQTLLNLHRPGWNPKDYDLEALALRKNGFYLKTLSTELMAYPDVIEALKWLRAQGVKTGVVSNAKRRELEAALHRIGANNLLDVTVSRDDVSAFKPDPTPYLFGAGALGFKPYECLAVEDSPPGLEAALMAKMPAAAVLTNFKRIALEQPIPGRSDLKPIWIGNTFTELLGWLKSLSN